MSKLNDEVIQKLALIVAEKTSEPAFAKVIAERVLESYLSAFDYLESQQSKYQTNGDRSPEEIQEIKDFL